MHRYRLQLSEILLHDNSETLVQSYISNNDSCYVVHNVGLMEVWFKWKRQYII